MADDTDQVLALVVRYASAQAMLEHQGTTQRDRQARHIRDLLEQAHALHTVMSADPQRWQALEDTGAAHALESMNTSYHEMSLYDIKCHGVTWEARL